MPRRATRRGVTLAELLVALAMLGVVLGTVSAVSVREQRLFADLAESSMISAQLREAGALLPGDLRAVASGAGDFAAGEMRDTSLQFRSTIASGVVCDTVAGGVVLAPTVDDATTFTSVLTAPAAGDTLWLFTPADSGDVWLPYRVSSTGTAPAGQCAARGPRLANGVLASAKSTLRLDGLPAPLRTVVGAPVRITRPARYSLYRASDGGWYLGARDWSTSTQRLNTIQPVAGPLLSAAAGGLAFHYLDSTGAALPTPVADGRAVVALQVQFRAQTADLARALAVAGRASPNRDSASVIILLRNRR